jgi:hypothetical protein
MIIGGGCFLLGFNPAIPREVITRYLDSRPEIQNWYSIFPGQIFIASDRPPRELSELIRGAFPSPLFILTHVDRNDCGGWLPEDAWDFIKQADRPPGLTASLARTLTKNER